jgi:biopolymer transport protein ExbD
VPQISSARPKPTQPDPNTIVVQVMRSGRLLINEDPSDWDALGPRLSAIFKERSDKVAFIKGDEEVAFAQVAHAIDIMKGAGIDHVGMITSKIEAGQ